MSHAAPGPPKRGGPGESPTSHRRHRDGSQDTYSRCRQGEVRRPLPGGPHAELRSPHDTPRDPGPPRRPPAPGRRGPRPRPRAVARPAAPAQPARRAGRVRRPGCRRPGWLRERRFLRWLRHRDQPHGIPLRVGVGLHDELLDRADPRGDRGPYPADGSNGRNVLNQSGVVRSDLTTSFGTASGVARASRSPSRLKVLDTANGGSAARGRSRVPLALRRRDGQYSMYSQAIAGRELPARRAGRGRRRHVTFTRSTPAAYDGRWPHMHFEVYPSLDDATTASSQAPHVADRAARGRRAPRSTRPTATAPARQPRADLAGHRHGVQRRLLAAARHGHRQRHDGLTATLNVPV